MGWLRLRAAVISQTQASVDSLVRITFSILSHAGSTIVLSTRARFSACSSVKPVEVTGVQHSVIVRVVIGGLCGDSLFSVKQQHGGHRVPLAASPECC